MRTRSPNAAFRPLVWLVLTSFLAQPLLPTVEAMASIQIDEAANFGKAKLVAPAQGERLAAGAVRFAYELPSDRAKSVLLVSRTSFDPTGWSQIPDDIGLVQVDAATGITSLNDLGIDFGTDTELWWAVATIDKARGKLHVSDVHSFVAEPKFTNRMAPNALLGPTRIGTLTRAEQEAAWAEMRSGNAEVDAAMGKLPTMTTASAGAPRIRLSAGYDFAPSAGVMPSVPEALSRSLPQNEIGSVGMHSYLVQFADPPSDEQRDAIARAGGATFSYVPDQAYLVRMSSDAYDRLSAESGATWIGDYEPAFKMSPLFEQASVAKTGKYMALVFPDANVKEVAAGFEARGYTVENITDNGINKLIRFRAGENTLADAAAFSAVAWVEPVIQNYVDNNNAQWVTQTGATGVRRIWLAGLRGQGQIVMTSDSGLNMSHNMFRDAAVPIAAFGDFPTHRKVIAYIKGGPDPAIAFGDQSSASYHGSHTGCTMVGNDSVNAGVSLNDGMAKDAKIYFMDLSGPTLGTGLLPPDDLNDLFLPPYLGNAGGAARMASNSWGSPVAGAYTLNSLAVDQFTYNHKDMYIAFSNGNSGPTTATIGSPASAKNVVGSGGTGNNASQNSIYTATSRGPTADGRRKPLFSTPGAAVVSANSGAAGEASLSGTSMSCPTGTGTMTLVRQYLTDGWYPTGAPVPANGFTPTSALLRAMAINAAENTVTGFTAPDNNIGYGRLKADSTVYLAGDTRKLLLVDQTDGVAQGQFAEYQVNVTEGTIAFEVSLAWTDYPGNPTAAVQLVNNLDLTVTNGVNTYKGNVFATGQSTTGGTADVRNVEENFRLNLPSTGIWTIRVTGTAVPIGPQPFALCITGGVGQTAGALALDRVEYGSSSTVEIQVTDTDAPPGPTVHLASNTEPVGEDVTLGGGSGVWTGTFPLTILGASTGDGFLSVSNGDQITATYQDASPVASLVANATVSLATPIISNVDALPQGPAGTFINFDTNLNAVGKVYYGLTPALELGSVTGDGARLTQSLLIANVTPGSLYYYDVEATALNGNQVRDDKGGAHYTFTGKKKADILLVTSDTGFPRLQAWSDAFNANGYDWDLWEGALAESPALGDRNTGFRSYQAVIWQSGLETYPPVSDVAAQVITDYLNGGGRLWAMGHDLGWAFGDAASPVYTAGRAAWLQNTLHTLWFADPTTWTSETGIAADPISGAYTGGVPYTPFRSGGAGDEVNSNPGTGTASFVWRNNEATPDNTSFRWENLLNDGSALTALWGGAPSRLMADYLEFSSMAPPYTTPSAIRNDILDKTLVWLFGRPRPSVAVTAPNGGETITGTSTNITWNETVGGGYNAAARTIEYSLDAGDTWVLVTNSAGASPYVWNVGSVPNSIKALVRVRVLDDGTPAPLAMTDASNAVFTIAHTGGDVVGPVVNAGTVASAPNPIVRPNPASLTATVSDVTTGGSGVAAAEWSIGGAPAAAGAGTAMTGVFGGNTVAVSINLDTTPFTPGPSTLWVRGQDGVGNWGEAEPLQIQINGPAPVGVGPIPTIAFLSQNAPNPFMANTMVRFGLPTDGRVELAIYGVSGQLVKRLASGSLPAGEHVAAWDGKDDSGRQVPAGVYLYKMSFGKTELVKKAVLAP